MTDLLGGFAPIILPVLVLVLWTLTMLLKHLGLDQVDYPRNRSPPSNLTDQQTTLF